jgi:zinc transport system substrate-binding protein
MVVSCAHEPSEAPRPIVVVSVPPQADLVEQLAGDFVDVVVMVPPGANPATYTPTMSQMRAASQMQMYIKVGHPHFPFEETWFNRIADASDHAMYIDGAKGLPIRDDDPHVWLAPSCMRIMADRIAAGLITQFPDRRKTIADNLERFNVRLESLDAEIRTRLQKHRGQKFLVFHPAWGYFARDYDLEQIAIEHDHKEPSPARLEHVIDQARADGIAVVFVQPQFSEQSAQLVAEAISGRVVPLDPLAHDWFGNMRHVAATMDEAFSR